MKKSTTHLKSVYCKMSITIFFLAFLLVFPFSDAKAERIVNVPSGANLTNVIHGDTTATGERIDDNTIYLLERDGLYEVTSPLNLNVKLHLRGEEGPGFLPAVFPTPTSTGWWPQVILTRGDIILENIYVSNQNGNVNKWGGIQALGNGTRVEVRNSQFEWDRAAAILLNADSITCIIEDTRVSKMGNRNIYQGNGRLVDTRSKYVDTLIVRNSTFYYLSDRVIRNMGGEINYFEFNHNTGFHVQGRHGVFQLAKVHTAKITNNLIINPIYGGNHPDTEEQTQPDSDNFYIITIDEILPDQHIEIRNNNFAHEPEIIAFWETLDHVSEPEVLEPLVIQAIGQDAVADAWFEELVTFSNVPPVPMDFLQSIYQNPEADTHPENQDIDNVGIHAIDCTYSEDYASFTAADRGFPLGDLNHYPELKALWLTGGSVSTADLQLPQKQLVKVYPNPVHNHATFAFELTKPMSVQISVFNLNGQKVAEVFNGTGTQGLNTIQWSPSESGKLAPGMYIYRFQSAEFSVSNSMVITR